MGPCRSPCIQRLAANEVVAELALPSRDRPQRTLLRIRVPGGWRVASANSGPQHFAADENGPVDLSALRGAVTVRFRVEKN